MQRRTYAAEVARLTVPMRRALARLQVAVSFDDAERIAEAGVAAAATVDFSRFKPSGGYRGTCLYLSAEIPRGWVLASGTGQGVIHPSNLAHVFVGEGRQLPLLYDICSAPAGVRMLSDYVMARHLGPDLDLLSQLLPGN